MLTKYDKTMFLSNRPITHILHCFHCVPMFKQLNKTAMFFSFQPTQSEPTYRADSALTSA